MDTSQLLVFIVAGLLLNLMPGPDVLFIVTRAVRQGVRAGVVAACGITAGCFVHIFAAALGVGALLASSDGAFNVLKWAGAVYLAWMGLKLLLQDAPSALEQAAAPPTDARAEARSVFFGAFLTNVLNPKVALFFLAFVPQFIAADAQDKTRDFLLLGLLFNANGMVVNVGWALGAAWLARRLGAVQRAGRWLDRVAGLLFVGFALRLAFAGNPSR